MIKIGDTLPDVTVTAVTPDGLKPMRTSEIFKGKKVVLFAVPGAFTPTCSERHLPGFLEHAEALRAKGVDTIACIAVNDGFVMRAWERDQGTEGTILMLADGSGDFTRAVGLELDLMARGLGMRSQRYALVADDQKIIFLGVEEGGALDASKAETVLAAL